MRIGLALSGGGARGVYHIGVLQALDELSIKPKIISGCSAGALVGALYAVGVKPKVMLDLALATKWFQFFKPSLPNRGFTNLEYIKTILEKHIPNDNFNQLNIPLKIVATNLRTGMVDIFENGPIIKQVLASCTVPMLFQPIEIDNNLYVDGGLIMNLPSSLIKNQCDYLIGVSLTPINEIEPKELQSMISLISRCLEISVNNNSRNHKAICDLLIESEAMSNFSKFDLKSANAMYQLGYEATMNAFELSELKKKSVLL